VSDQIDGYRELTSTEISLINDAKNLERKLNDFTNEVKSREGDPRCLAIAKTEFEKGFMFLVKAIAKPDNI
jgi:hypothetical protein